MKSNFKYLQIEFIVQGNQQTFSTRLSFVLTPKHNFQYTIYIPSIDRLLFWDSYYHFPRISILLQYFFLNLKDSENCLLFFFSLTTTKQGFTFLSIVFILQEKSFIFILLPCFGFLFFQLRFFSQPK